MVLNRALVTGLMLGILVATWAVAGEGRALDRVRVLALSPGESCAVVAGPGGLLKVVRVGDSLPSASARVVEVLADRLVVDLLGEAGAEGESDNEPERVRAWIFPAKGPGGRSRVRVLSRRQPAAATIGVPLAAKPSVPGSVPAGARIRRAPDSRQTDGAESESPPTEFEGGAGDADDHREDSGQEDGR